MYLLDIRDLELVNAVAEEGTVTAAATRLHATQSAFSHRLKQIEDRLGVPLFVRGKRKMTLTPAGERVHASARAVLGELQKVEAELTDASKGNTGIIRMTTGCYTCYRWLPAMVAKFRAKHPGVEIRIDEKATHHALTALESGRTDLAVVYSAPLERCFRATPIFDDEMVFAFSPRHRLAKKSAISASDLGDETLLIYPPREESILMNEVVLPAGVRPKSVLEFPLTEAILELAASGHGVAFVARWAADPYLRARRIATRPLDRGGFNRTWFAVTLSAQAVPPYLAAFIDCMWQAANADMMRGTGEIARMAEVAATGAHGNGRGSKPARRV